jgi:methylenetetrahydrofolate dehydrogenase (NADP+) / methenyltetrahydrofolate cyclohydrolase
MAAKIISGRALADEMQLAMQEEIHQQVDKTKVSPGLAVVLVGDNPASQVYVRMKTKACEKIGIYAKQVSLPKETKQEELEKIIRELNHDPKIHGILVQLPLPEHINSYTVIETIHPNKDVDGLHPLNLGNLLLGTPRFIACTPAGIMALLKKEKIEVKGKNAVVVGRSNIVGKPMAILLMMEHATVTICHTRTVDLPAVTSQADILIAAAGKAEMITGSMVKPGAVVIDVGSNKVESKMVGDVDFAQVSAKAGFITPVPGGVGPMTITMLLKNTVQAYKEQVK